MKNINFKKVMASSLLSFGVMGSAFANIHVPVSINMSVGQWDKVNNFCNIESSMSYRGMLQISSIYHEGTDLNENTVLSGKVSDATYHTIMERFVQKVKDKNIIMERPVYNLEGIDPEVIGEPNCWKADGVFRDSSTYKLTMSLHYVVDKGEVIAVVKLDILQQ